MQTPLTRVERRRARRRRRVLALLVVLGCAAAVAAAAIVATSGGSSHAATSPKTSTAAGTRRTTAQKPRSTRLVERATGRLAAPVQDAAAVALVGDRAMLLGGLTAADTSRTDIRIATPARDRAAGQLPTALHDTAAVRLGNDVYLFGGGTGANTQSDAILRVPGARRCRNCGRAAAGAELRPVGGRDRRHCLHRRWLHREPLARHDRRLAAGLAGASRRASAVSAALRGGRGERRQTRDRGRLARERHRERHRSGVHAEQRPRRRGSGGCPLRRRTPPRRRSATSPTWSAGAARRSGVPRRGSSPSTRGRGAS